MFLNYWIVYYYYYYHHFFFKKYSLIFFEQIATFASMPVRSSPWLFNGCDLPRHQRLGILLVVSRLFLSGRMTREVETSEE